MLTVLEKRWPLISILLLIVLLASLLIWHSIARTASIAMLVLGPGMAIVIIIRRQSQFHRASNIDRTAMLHHIFFEVLGLLLAIALAILLSQVAAGVAVPLLGSGLVSTVILMIAVVLLGLGAAWLVKVTWGRWTKAQ
ncbi:MAG: hypothetical protein M1282_00470 [Chloroflexi bacterium]|nr:hypothetical protein [Chloroflexota bacterium]